MLREGKSAAIPFALMAFLWGSVAAWVHLGLGVGAWEVGVTHDDHKALMTFAEHIGNGVDLHQRPIEIAFGDSQQIAPPIPTPPPPDPTVTPPEKKSDPPKPKVEEKKKAEPEQPKPKQNPIAVEKKQEKVAPPAPAQPLAPDKRIAVRQHVQANQQDNPTAHFIGDQANTVKEETVATMTSHDRDDENPTPSRPHQNSEANPGDSDKTKIAEADDHRGTENKAPGERGTEFDVQHDARPLEASQLNPTPGPKSVDPPRGGGDGNPQAPSPVQQPELAPGNVAPPSPNVVSGDGSWTFNIARTPGSGDNQATGPGSTSRTLQAPSASTERQFGLGGNPGPGQINPNLNTRGVIAAVGADQLRREREADGERRRSEHRGSFQASNFERWRSAIENYVSSVKSGNQTALNTAAVPFATYLNSMHNRIHPIFADSFLGSLDSLPASNPLNDQHLVTRLEIVLTKDGHLAKMGIVKTSGVTGFDIAALDSVQRASPFGPAPSAIVSPDGQVYLHWEFHRDEVYACSTMNARPFMLNVPAGGVPEQPGPLNPSPNNTGPHERGLPTDSRQGSLVLPTPGPS